MSTDLILLGILHSGEYYGYEIMKIIKSVMVQITDITTGTLYYKLKGLEKRGLIIHTEEQDGRRPVRFRYSITPEGRETFQRMAQDHIAHAGRPYWPVMSSLFFINLLDPDESIRAIRDRIERMEAELARLDKLRTYLQQGSYPFQANLIVQHGIEHIRADIGILKRFIENLSDPDLKLFDTTRMKERLQQYMDIMPDLERV
jgi:DNA-binding PadR family transcriptional regulator